MTDPRLSRFRRAQESVYGDLTTPAPETWTPPPNSAGHRGRYLWTDAFGVINFITLHRESQQSTPAPVPRNRFLTLARRLVETVHSVLGRTRDGRSLLPGATEQNPLAGGLRIGKVDADGPDGDGQYHHYLTIWMFALNRLSLATGDMTYNRQAVALGKAFHPHFVVERESARPRMVWKVGVDLTANTPLVASEGNLDPVDGFLVFRLVQALAMKAGEGEVFAREIADYRRMVQRKGTNYVSNDPLDAGMALWTAHWFINDEDWGSLLGLYSFQMICDMASEGFFKRDVGSRLAFREFAASMACLSYFERGWNYPPYDFKYSSDAVLDFWTPYMEQSSASVIPESLQPITNVMYAAALMPGAFRTGYLGPEPTIKPENFPVED